MLSPEDSELDSMSDDCVPIIDGELFVDTKYVDGIELNDILETLKSGSLESGAVELPVNSVEATGWRKGKSFRLVEVSDAT